MRVFGAVLLTALLSGCGTSGADMPAAAEDAPVALVRTAAAELGSTTDALSIYGAAEAGPGGEQSIIAPREAILVRILAPTGTAVGAGAAIATLRPSPTVRADYAKAANDATVANAAYARARRLRTDGLVADAEVEAARGAAATANALRARLGGGGTTLRAPVAGTVHALVARPGDQLPAGTTVATIAAAGERRARFGIDPAVALRIRPGQPIRIEAMGGGPAIDAVVVGVDPQVDAATRLASVFARVPGTIGIGQPLRARISVGATATGLTVPYAALLDDGGKTYVFVIAKGVAARRDVEAGSSSGDRVTILRGLNARERVVTEGGTAINDGMKVREDSGGK